MTTYKELFGKAVKFLSSDPANDAEGQVWYNSTSGTFKSVVATAAWSSSAPLINAYRAREGGFGTQTAAVVSGGFPPNVAVTEEYNGSGWSAGNNMNTARQGGRGSGTQTAGVYAAGRVFPTPSNATEEYDGTSWTSVNPTNTARLVPGVTGSGPQTATAIFGGEVNPSTVTNETENYNGTSWTVSGNLPSPAYVSDGLGVQTAGLAMGNVAAEYDGSVWTAANNLTTSRSGGGAAGIQTSGLYFGGQTPAPAFTTATENYDGTSWSNSPATLGTARNALSGMGTSSAALAAAGDQPGGNKLTEEYNVSGSIITGAAWASGNNGNVNRENLSGAGTSTATVIFGGYSQPTGNPVTTTEEYDGTNWSTVPGSLNTGRYALGGAGTQTSALAFSGENSGSLGPGGTTATEEYDGSTWTTVNTYPAANRDMGGTGTQTAALSIGGAVSPGAQSYEYDGTNWTAGGNLNTSRRAAVGGGTLTAAVAVKGLATGSYSNASEEYNGTSWTTISSAGVASYGANGGGTTQDNIIVWGGATSSPAPATTSTEGYDGTGWFTSANLATGKRKSGFSRGSLSSAVDTEGSLTDGQSATLATQEFTGETSVFNYKTITTS